ncbi:putative nucleotidyltransferase substrate binding domain-containing protein [Sulfuriflexus sp.]|uniref:putative nucleotidyltransferase substrate binding domain-containing protein n=1 Tax=Sulfuriflexus sp. TaxID=2015443 RepID=UPI0028CEBCB6|nr:putative nucleotidyltransferase substrate binding domain-containing protein [Sulfuriflexus sp.]MDT8405314.1 putative nucleotidyltransferase substrate binding domain-containing protein [Sulfuriflexus sp.]
MQIELLEIRDFLANCSAFDQLPADELDALPGQLQISYLRRGNRFPPADSREETAGLLAILRQGAIELRDEDGRLYEKLAETDCYAGLCERPEDEPVLHAICSEDCLLYLLPCHIFERLRDDYPAFDARFNASLSHRLREALQRQQSSITANGGLSQYYVSDCMHRKLVSIGADTAIQQAAQCMHENDSSALLITDEGQLQGLITDKDLRSRCLAQGLSMSTAVSEIMTTDIQHVTPSTRLDEALLLMSRENIHHLPVLEAGKAIGVISSTDILRQQSLSPVHMVGAIHKSRTVAELARIAKGMPEQQQQLISSGSSAQHIGNVLASIGDAITEHLFYLAMQQLGPAPISFCWFAVGSQARREFTAHSDQDNALLLSDEYTAASHGEYFTQLARFVSDGLNACGIVYCPGDVMATNDEWRQPMATWKKYFSRWVDIPEPKALLLACNFFDMRCIYGDASLFSHLQAFALQKASANRIFLAHLAANALDMRPPLGFFRQFVLVHDGEHDDSFDIKLHGVMPIVELARLYALSEGLAEVNTYERLRAAAGSLSLSREGGENLHDALSLIALRRLQHQSSQYLDGLEMDNYLKPTELSALECQHLKDAFAVISELQAAVSHQYQSGLF